MDEISSTGYSMHMRNNVIFSGIRENNDNLEKPVRDFMSSSLKVSPEVVRGITFSRVHRLGRPAESKTRPIIARFEHYKLKEIFKGCEKLLEGTSIWLNDHFPAELNARRKVLLPIMK